MNNVMREIKYSEPIRGKLNPNIIEKSQVPFLAAEEVERDLKRLIDVYKLRIPYPISEYFQDYALYNSLRSKFN